VAFCLNTDPAARPTSEHLLQRVSALRRQRLPDAAPQGAPPARADGATPGGAVATGVARRWRPAGMLRDSAIPAAELQQL
jgi:hypothetical protein